MNLFIKKKCFPIIVILILIIVLQIFLRLYLPSSLDRDEFIYGYIAQRLLAGDTLYRDVFDNKPPVIYWLYTLVFKIFGQSLGAIRIVALIFSLITTLLIFLIGRLIWGNWAGLSAAAFHAIFSGGPYVEGTTANAEIFMLPFIILSFYFFLLAGRRKDKKFFLLFLAGLSVGLAFMIKPVAITNLAALVIFCFFLPRKIILRAAIFLILGFSVFPAVFSGYFVIKGTFSEYFLGAFLIHKDYLSHTHSFFLNPIISLEKAIQKTFEIALVENSILWIAALGGIIYFLINSLERKKIENLIFIIWLVFSFLGVMMGGNYFPHYYLQVIPALSFLAGYFLYSIKKIIFSKNYYLLKLLFFLFFIPPIISHHVFYKKVISYRLNYWIHDALLIGSLIRDQAKPTDTIFVWDKAPEIYFYSQRKSASKFFVYAPWAEKKLQVKKSILNDLQEKKPSFIIINPQPDTAVFEELDDFIKVFYQPEEIDVSTIYQWQVYKKI